MKEKKLNKNITKTLNSTIKSLIYVMKTFFAPDWNRDLFSRVKKSFGRSLDIQIIC